MRKYHTRFLLAFADRVVLGLDVLRLNSFYDPLRLSVWVRRPARPRLAIRLKNLGFDKKRSDCGFWSPHIAGAGKNSETQGKGEGREAGRFRRKAEREAEGLRGPPAPAPRLPRPFR